MRRFEASQADQWREIRNELHKEGVTLRKQYPKFSDAPPEIQKRLLWLKANYNYAVANVDYYTGIAIWDEQGDEK